MSTIIYRRTFFLRLESYIITQYPIRNLLKPASNPDYYTDLIENVGVEAKAYVKRSDAELSATSRFVTLPCAPPVDADRFGLDMGEEIIDGISQTAGDGAL